MNTSNETVELRITQSVDAIRVQKMARLLNQAEGVQSELWSRVISWVSPEVRDMLYLLHGLTLLRTSLGDMLNPGSNQLQSIRLETQIDGLEEDLTKASAMLTALKAGERVGLGRAGNSSVHVRSQKGTNQKGRALAKRKRDAEGG